MGRKKGRRAEKLTAASLSHSFPTLLFLLSPLVKAGQKKSSNARTDAKVDVWSQITSDAQTHNLTTTTTTDS